MLVEDTRGEEDGTSWGLFQEVRGAWERIHETMRDALHPAMRRLALFQSMKLVFRIDKSKKQRARSANPGRAPSGGRI